MNCLVTGASGFIGSKLALALAEKGHTVHALLRSPGLSPELNHPNIRIFKGDILDATSIEESIKDCHSVFHLAAFAKPFSKDPGLPYRINVEGTRNILASATGHEIKKVVFVSSAATVQPSGGNPSSEGTERVTPYFNAYESTKAMAEELSLEYARQGLHVTIVKPTRVYGPGKLTVSNSTTRMIGDYSRGKWRIIPGNGKSIGNYVYVDDVVRGIVAAEDKGRAGESYILGGTNLSFNELFRTLARVTGRNRIMIRIPYFIMWTMVGTMQLVSRVSGNPPLITLQWVKKYLSDWEVTSEKAIKALGYVITPFEEGAAKTLQWINNLDDDRKNEY